MNLSFNFIGIVTRDLPSSLAFYRSLGLDIPAGHDQLPHVEVTLPGGMRLAWDTVEMIRSFDPRYEPPVGSHRIAFAFQAESAAGVDAAYERVVAEGWRSHAAPWDSPWGQRYATVLDPDGNAVDIYAPLEGTA